MAAGTRVGTGYVVVSPDFSGFQEKVAKKLNETLGPAMDRAGANANKRLSKSLGNNSSLRSSFAPLLKRFEKFGDDAGEQIASKIGKGSKRAEGDMFGLSGAIKEAGKQAKSTTSRAKILANDTFGIARAATDASQGYKVLRNATRDWSHDAKAAESVGRRLSKGITSLFSDLSHVGRNLKAAAGGFGSFEGIMAKANRGFQFFRNILGSIKFPALVAGAALLAQSLSALTAGAVAVVSALGPLSGALIALPAAALAGAQAVGVLKLALSGIGDAVKAGLTSQIKGGEQATQTLRTQENAAEALADAHRTLSSSERDAKFAQEDLTKARKEATRQLEDMRIASQESGLTEREGTLALRESRRELNKTLREPSASGLDIQGAEQAVEQAKFSLDETRLDAKRARSDYAEAQKKGVEGSSEVVSAKRAVADANRSVADAERGVAKAVRENTDAMTQQGSAATALQQKMAALTPAGRKFAKFLISLKPQFDSLRQVAAKGLLPGAEKGIKSTLGNLGVVKKIVGETSGALGKLAAKAGAKLGSEAWGRDLGKVGETNTRILSRMGDAGLNVADAFRNILVSAEPLLEWMSKGTLKFSEWLKISAQAGRETGTLAHFFGETREAMEKVWRILKPLGEGLLNVGKIARPLGNEILDSLGNAAEGWAKWTGSIEGQNQLKNYFKEVKPAVFEIGRLIRDATDAFFELGKQKGVANVLRLVRTVLIPALRDGAGAVTGFVSSFIEEFGELKKGGASTFDALIQVLVDHAAEAGVRIAKAMVNAFFNSGPLGKLVVGGWLLSKFGGISTLSKVGRTLGLGLGGGAAAGIEEGVGASKGKLTSRFLSLGKTLGIAFATYGFFEAARTAFSEGKGAKGLTDTLHNAGVGFFRSFGVNIGETTAEGFSKGFKARIGSLSDSGFIGQQSIITPALEARAKEEAKDRLDKKFPGRGGSDLEGLPEFEEEFQRSLSALMRDVKARRASAKDLFKEFWSDMGPDEKTFARQLRAALVQGDRLLQQTGVKLPKVRLESNPQQTAKATKGILGSFDFLRKGIGANLQDITKVSKRAGQLIVSTFGAGTKETRELTARNMRLTAQAVAQAMTRSGDVTKKGMERVQNLIRNADLISPSRKQAEGFGREWSKGMDHTKEVTGKGIAAMIAEAKKMPGPMRKVALETWLDQAKAAQRSGDLTTDAFRKMRSKVFAEFGQMRSSGKAFNKEFAEGFVDMANQSGGAMGVLMKNVSNLSGALGDKGKLNWKIIDAKLSKDPNGASLGRQAGGPVPKRAFGGLAATVPGTSTGDRHILSLNGRPVAKVESREGIFVGNRNLMGAVKQANDAVPRFQEGGLVGKVQQLRRGGLVEPKLEGQAGPLKQLGQAAIHKVFEGAKGYLDKHRAATPASGGNAGEFTGAPANLKQLGDNAYVDSHTLAVTALLDKMFGLTMSSGFRSVQHNDEIGGAPGSLHTHGSPANPGATDSVGSESAMAAYIAYVKQHVAGIKEAFVDNYAGLGDNAHVGFFQRGGLLKMLQKGGFAGGGYTVKGAAASAQQMRTAAEIQEAGDKTTAPHLARVAAEMAATQESDMGSAGNTFQLTRDFEGVSPTDSAFKQAIQWFTKGFYDGPILGAGGGIAKSHKSNDPTLIAQEVEGSAYPTAYAPWKSEGQKWTDGWSADSSAASTGADAGVKEPPKETVPGSYKGLKAGDRVPLGPMPAALEEVNAELAKLQGKGGKGGLVKRYRNAQREANKEGKPAIAQAIGENISLITARIHGLVQRRTALRFKAVKKNLTERFRKATARFGRYGINIEEAGGRYEEASQFAEQLVGLEPQQPEIPVQQKGESDKAYEQRSEASEQDYVRRYTAYIEQEERPAFGGVLQRVADWRNTVLGAEIYGLNGEPSVADSETAWEKQTRSVDHRIHAIRQFAKDVIERKNEWIKKYEEGHEGKHPKDDEAPQKLKELLKERTRELSEELPQLTLKDTKLREAIQEARGFFFPGGKDRLGPNKAGIPATVRDGSGSFEETLATIQGIHQYPDQHSLLDAGAIGPPNVAGRFGGVIWGVNNSISELGLKVSSALHGLEKPAEGGGEDTSERDSILEDLLKKANERLAIKANLEPVLNQFEASYPLPFAGTFHGGGTIGGPSSQEYMAKVRGAEHVLTPEMMAALSPAAETSSGAAPVIESLVIHPDGSATMRFEGREFESAVQEVVRGTRSPLVGSGANRAFRP